MSKKTTQEKGEDEEETDDLLHLNELTTPIYTSHVKPGNTLCSNGEILFMQDGSTTIEFRLSPQFLPKKIPWRFGLVRDIVWCADLGLFILITKDSLYSISPQPLFTEETPLNKPLTNFTINTYSKIKPMNSNNSFWRCACAGKTIYILYSGFGTIIDIYSLGQTSCKLIDRWLPPQTCAVYEGIWCLRYKPESDQLGITIMDSRTNQWRMEIRTRTKFSVIWQTVLPVSHGDCEISSLGNDEWLAVNTCGIRLIQVVNKKLKAAVEYERELKNAVIINNLYFAVRTKNTLEIHKNKRVK